MSNTLFNPRRNHRKIVLLAVAGLLLFVASLTVRFMERPREPETIAADSPGYYSQFFGIGLDTGTVENLGCSVTCPIRLIVEYDATNPSMLTGKFLGVLEGTQTGSDPARVFLITPAGSEDIAPVADTDAGITISTDTVSGETANVTTVTIPAIDDAAFFGVEFTWRPGRALTDDGIGRHTLQVPYLTSHPVLTEQNAYSLDIGSSESSLKEAGLEVTAEAARIGAVTPDPDGRPDPRRIFWRVGTDQNELYYAVTIEDPTVRFVVGLVNEQTLFISGLLLGALMGAVASDWITNRRAGWAAGP